MVIAIPAAAIAAGAVMLWLAIDSYDGLVVDDYYKQGKEINLRLERDRKAETLGYRGQLLVQARENTVRLNLSSGEGAPLPESLEVKLLHSTRAGFDATVKLDHLGQGAFAGKLDAPLAKGSWNIHVGNEEWRIVGRIMIPGSPGGALAPATAR